MAEEGGGGQGRTMWDVVALVLQSKGLWKTLLALLAIVSALSYFGVLTFSYNDGLKVVFGPDPEKARKREEERVLKAALDRAEAHRATLYAHALGTWRGSLKQDGSERVSQQTRCT